MFLFSLPFPVRKTVETGKCGNMWTSSNKTSVSGELMFLFSLPFPVRKTVETGKCGNMWNSSNKTSVSGELATSSASWGTLTACSMSNMSASSWL